MLVHDQAFAPPLAAAAYHEDRFFAAEVEALFRDHWHCVGLETEVDAPGASLATEVLDVPVVVRNADGRLVAFENVCPHRASRLVPPGARRMDVLRCQYHGWEFDAAGCLARLPDGPSFKGWKAAGAGLRALPVERFLGLVFVSVGAPPPIREAFGGIAAQLEEHFEGYRPVWTWTAELGANWKVLIENTVEGYHVPCLHPTTFQSYPPDEHYRHVLDDGYSLFENLTPGGLAEHLRELAASSYHAAVSRNHTQIHVFPNHLVDYWGIARFFFYPVPIAARRSRYVLHLFMPGGLRPGLLPRAFDACYAARLRGLYEQVLAEDSGVWADVQRGCEASTFDGVLSCREERVYHFQRYVRERVGRVGG